MKKVAIAVCYFYKEEEYLNHESCIPLQVGFNKTHIDLGIQKDNEGDNRSDKNSYYSELSGLYWLWRNVDAQYKGLFHHRRALTLEKESLSSRIYYTYRLMRCMLASLKHSKDFFALHQISFSSDVYYKRAFELLNVFENDYINKYDIVAPIPAIFYPFSVEQHFSIEFGFHFIPLLNSIISDKWAEYNTYWHRTLKGRRIYYGNISIMRSDLFDSYCLFMFGVLDELERILISEGYYISLTEEKSMSRKLGYVGELLTNTFILSQIDKGVKIKELCVMLRSDARQSVQQ